jgi:lactoylglutathione lyase
MKFSFVTIYVQDIMKIIKFYESVFELKVKFIHESGLYAEMETGDTVLSFSQTKLAESIIPKGYIKSSPEKRPSNIQIGFEPEDVKKTLKIALEHGATLESDYEIKPWGWESAMIRDIEGNLVELAKKAQS